MEQKQLSIIGATGDLGIPVVKYLLSFGFRLNLIVRNLAKAQKIFGHHKNLEFCEADLTSVDDLRKALANTSYLYLNLSTKTTDINLPFATEREGVANIMQAIDPTKIKQIITISGLGAFNNVKETGFHFIPNIIRKQGHKIIKNSGIPYTILHCSWFADSFIIYQRKNNYPVIGPSQNLIYFINAYDYSLQLSKAIGNPEACFKEFPIQGKIGYTHPKAARIFLDIYSPKTRVAQLPSWLISGMALFNPEMKFVKHMSDYSYATQEEFIAEECSTYGILGEPKMSLIDYAQKVKAEKIYDHLNV